MGCRGSGGEWGSGSLHIELVRTPNMQNRIAVEQGLRLRGFHPPWHRLAFGDLVSPIHVLDEETETQTHKGKSVNHLGADPPPLVFMEMVDRQVVK